MADDSMSIDDDIKERSVENGRYANSQFEIYEEKLQICTNEIKVLKSKVRATRQQKFHFLRKYFNQQYFNTLTEENEIKSQTINSSNDSDTPMTQLNKKNENDIENNNNDNKQQLTKQWAQEKLGRQFSMKLSIQLSGHGNKVYAIDWHKNNTELISAARDAKCMIWNIETGLKKTAFNLDTEFTMDCKYSPNCAIVACGGLDDTCTIYNLSNESTGFIDLKPTHKLQEHSGYISSIAFMDDNHVLTASGDQTVILWDINKGESSDIYGSHLGDVMSVSVNPKDENIFVTGSIDYTCRVWDIREKNNSNPKKLAMEALNTNTNPNPNHSNTTENQNQNQNNSYLHSKSQSSTMDSEFKRWNPEPNPCVTHIYSMDNENDVNYVKWFPNGDCFAAGTEDGIVKLYDLRTFKCLNEFNFQESLGLVNPYHTQSLSNPNADNKFSHYINKEELDLNNENEIENENENNNSDEYQEYISRYRNSYEGVASMDFSNSGQFLFVCYNGTSPVLIWDVLTGRIVDELGAHQDHVPKVILSKDGQKIAACCWDKTNYIYTRKQ